MLPFLDLADPASYRRHYEHTLCRGGIATHDGITVFFRREEFDHAFFESSGRRGENDIFSLDRARRMGWIAPALADPNVVRFQGWITKKQCSDPTRRVTLFIDDFVVVVALRLRQDDRLKANFVTCFPADAKTREKLNKSPLWTLEACLDALR